MGSFNLPSTNNKNATNWRPGGKLKKTLLIGLLASALTGCAVRPPADPVFTARANAPLACKDKAQCDYFWQRAQVWISTRSAYKIQTATDVVIQTYGPVGVGLDLAHRAVRENNPDGSGRISIKAMCNNYIRCDPPVEESQLKFKAYLQNPDS